MIEKTYLKRFMRGSCEKNLNDFYFKEAKTRTTYLIKDAKITYRGRGDRWEWVVIKDHIKYTFRMVGVYPHDAYSLEEIAILLPRSKYTAFNRRAGRVRHQID